ncbi:RRP12-like protein isoform X1 [Ananas comosus]|uniref:RRP12-like protein n=1 Tax=Ananas comosus TaxID=4615 RepID=A0A199USK4_ANACO|nr:RRP12-like protein isoform X1 [Ananas comosus]OAY67734.1 RRP12-like protein [Ananas comosus]
MDVDMDTRRSQTPEETADTFEDLAGADDDDLGSAVLVRHQSSPREDHQHLCAAVGAMAQTLKDQRIPLTPVAYFGATAASLDRLSRDPSAAAASDPVTTALLTFLSSVLPRVSAAVLRSKGPSVAESVVRILGFRSLPDGGVKSGLKCIAHLIAFGDKSNWSRLSPYYGVLLGFVTDHRPKVRKQSHASLRDVLQSFQKSAVLVPASEVITETFERFLLLAGGSSSSKTAASEEGPRGALEILHILNALKDCLPLMATKSVNMILGYFKRLLELHQPIVTKSILEILQSLCNYPTSEGNPELLLDLLCSLAVSASEENSADEMASIARLLHVGMKKVYYLNKQICTLKLPVIFTALGDILASGHEEAVFAAMEALKGLMHSCIDKSLVEHGISQIKARLQGLRAAPTVIEKICAILESFLGFQYNDVWDLSFHVLSSGFDILGEASCYLMANALKSLADIEKLPDEDFPYRKQLHECIGSAIGAMGPKEFLNVLHVQNISDANVWILPLLKQYTVGASLSFFVKEILKMISCIQENIPKLVEEDKLFSAKRAEGYIYSLWSLLPSFCNYACDTASSFGDLQNVLCDTLRNEPSLHGVVCSSLQILIQQNKGILSETKQKDTEPEDELSKHVSRAKSYYTKELAEGNLKAIRASSSKFLKVLYSIFLETSKDNGGSLQSTINEIASIADNKVIKKFFVDTMKELLEATQEAIKSKQIDDSSSKQIDDSSSMQIDALSSSKIMRRALLLDFAVSLLPGLGVKEIDLLFSAIKPAIEDEGLIQKKAYKILSVILKDSDQFVKRNLDVLLDLMIKSLTSCQFPSKRYRLQCLYYLIVYISKDSFEQRKRDIVSSFLTEILLALKEANKKTRNRAYDLLVEIGHACENGNNGGSRQKLQQLFSMVAGGLAGETPHMISAAIKGLARLTYEFSDLIGLAYNLLPSAFLLLQRKNREIVKANLGFIKVLVAKSKAEGLQEHLRDMVEGLFKWQDDTKNHFKAKIKLLLELLIRKCGLDAVKAVMPEEHMKLLTNIRKIKDRKERKTKSSDDGESLTARTSISRQSRWNHTRIFSDFGDEDGSDEGDAELGMAKSVNSSYRGSKAFSSRSTRKRKTAKSLAEELIDQSDGDPLDLLDPKTMRTALQSSSHTKRNRSSLDEPEIDPEGRLIVREEGSRPRKEKSFSSDQDLDTKSFLGSRSLVSTSTRGQKRRKTAESGWSYTGKEYTSKRASGDLKKKDKLEPYAYWPLDRKLLNRRAERKASARKGMASVMKKFTKKLEGTSATGALSVKEMKVRKKVKGSNKRK